MKVARRSSFLLQVLVVTLVSIPFATGCEAAARDPSDGALGSEDTDMTLQPQPGALRIDLEIADVPDTDPLPITIRFTNTGPERLVLELLGREVVFDLILSNSAGVSVWRRLNDDPQPAILRLVILESGDDFELTDTWDRRSTAGTVVPPGRYQLSGVVPTSGQPLTAGPIALEVGVRPD